MNLKNFPKRLDSKTSYLRITVPENLDLALEGLIRKVLREQPKTDDIHSFAADYFETLLKIRDKAGTKYTPAQLGPFHNDEDAFEMTKLASSFNKPLDKKKNEESLPVGSDELHSEKTTERKIRTKHTRRPQSKEALKKDEKPNRLTKQATSNLVENLAKAAENRFENEKKEVPQAANEELGTTTKESPSSDEELLTTDPIKELVEQELKMESDSRDRKSEDVTRTETAPNEEVPLQNQNIQDKKLVDDIQRAKPEELPQEDEKKPQEFEEINEKSAEVEVKANNERSEEVIEKTLISTNKLDAERESEENTNSEKVNKETTEATAETNKETEEVKHAKGDQLPLSISDAELTEEKKEIDEFPSETEKNEMKTSTELSNTTDMVVASAVLLGLKEVTDMGITSKDISSEREAIFKEQEAEVKDEQSNFQQMNNIENKSDTQMETVGSKPEAPETNFPYESDNNMTELKNIESEDLNTNNNSTQAILPIEETMTRTTEISEKTDDHRGSLQPDITEKSIETAQDEDTENPSLRAEPLESTQNYVSLEEKEKPSWESKGEEAELKTVENITEVQELVPTNEDSYVTESHIEQAQPDQSKTEEATTKTSPESTAKENEKSEEDKHGASTQEKPVNDETEAEDEANAGQLCHRESTKTDEALPPTEKISGIQSGSRTEPEPNFKADEDENQNEEPELCIVIDSRQTLTNETTKRKNSTEELKETTPAEENQSPPEEELCTVVDIQNIPKNEVPEVERSMEISEEPKQDLSEMAPAIENQTMEEAELCAVVDVQNLPGSNITGRGKLADEPEPNEIIPNDQMQPKELQSTTPDVQHIIRVEATEPPEVLQTPEEVQIKTIQTHYYDTLQIPEAAKKEFKVFSLSESAPTNSLLGITDIATKSSEALSGQIDPKKSVLDDNKSVALPLGFSESQQTYPSPLIKSSRETAGNTENGKPVEEIPTESPYTVEALGQRQLDETDDAMDLMTPTSDYSLNLSELSWPTVAGMFLDSERQHSSLEKAEIRHVTPTCGGTAEKPLEKNPEIPKSQQVEEVIHKTVLPSHLGAVPIPPRDADELNQEASVQTSETAKDEKPEDDSEGSSSTGDTPLISVEIKTVIETQVLDDDEDERGVTEREGEEGYPELEVRVEAKVDVQNIVEETRVEPTFQGAEKEASDGKDVDKSNNGGESIKTRSISLEEGRTTTGEQTAGAGSSGETDSTTTSSAATEIKRKLSSARTLLTSQSFDLGGKNPLVKTRSLSTFRHGVTDFEVWSAIEKELEEAATKIQSKYRSYKTRKKLLRENAVQITTEESSTSTTPAEADAREEGQQSTGEFHDSIVLSEHPR